MKANGGTKETMADTFRTHDSISGSTNGASKSPELAPAKKANTTDAGRTVLVGILGGVASSVGFAIYQRLPADQREKLNGQIRSFIGTRINELRANFSL